MVKRDFAAFSTFSCSITATFFPAAMYSSASTPISDASVLICCSSTGLVNICPPIKQPTCLPFTIIGATKSIRPAWQEYTMDAPFLRAMDAPFLLHCSQRTRPMLEALVYLQNSQKLEPSVTATPSAFVVITAISLVSE